MRWLYVVSEADGAELPLLVTEDIKEVAAYIGKSLDTTRWYFYPASQKRRADKGMFSKNLYVPYRFEKISLEGEYD